jgi:uncharacterized protein YcbX
MIARIARIRRHPIKSMGGEDIVRTRLDADRLLPGDRLWGLLSENGERHAGQGAHPERWLPKSCFLRGAAASGLQAVQGGWGAGEIGGPIRLSHPDLPDLAFDPRTEGQMLVDWVRPLWPADRPAPTRLVQGPTGWTDVSKPWISILSLSSLADMEAWQGRLLGVERWRANLWVEGWEAYAERDLVGHTITLGKLRLRVTETIGRCAATSVDTATGRIDTDMPEALKAHFGHSDFGIYAEVITGGEIALGDEVRV